ncbi:hypothetical protein HMPREF1549_00480 [Actinomyces johnsonii F0510]|uniref:Uncharacterized protein n=1 Tax=Actinomyces johnsonii F0510 TaxID=1227262 RepID=U1RTM0_9ACTO|nr:hypothetical protein HMPREF1549_00480 [Actinomyces johnsonii F0510]
MGDRPRYRNRGASGEDEALNEENGTGRCETFKVKCTASTVRRSQSRVPPRPPPQKIRKPHDLHGFHSNSHYIWSGVPGDGL